MAIDTRTARVLVASMALAWAGAAYAQAPSNQDLVGAWNITMTSPHGSHPTTLTIREDGGQLTGTLTGLPGPSPVTVKTSEGGVTLSFSADYQGQAYPVVLRGTITGTDIKGTIDYAAGAAAGDFSGSKAATTPADGTALAGTWIMNTPSSSNPGWTMDLTQEGGMVTGTLRNADRGIALALKGTLENGALALAVSGDRTGNLKATLDSGELKDGHYEIGNNSGSWSATRKP